MNSLYSFIYFFVPDYIRNIPPLEIVVKKYCEGTDKHSYYNIVDNRNIVLESGEYITGPYVRFDWRNPNHLIDISSKKVNLIENPYYYIVEHDIGKEDFFEKYIRKSNKIKPFGDKTVSEEIIHEVMDITKAKTNVLKMFYTIQYYFGKIGLEIKDVCFMLDQGSNTFWSEINQDCMRIKVHNSTNNFDKDIWRAGGSSSKEIILKKWVEFNNIMKEYFKTSRFHEVEMLSANIYPYQEEILKIVHNSQYKILPTYKNIYSKLSNKYNRSRRVIVTMDLYDGKPVLVQKGIVTEIHSNGNVNEAFQKISIFPDILVVDLNGAIDNVRKNREIIKSLATKYYIHSGGGLRTIQDIQDILESSARRIVIGSNLDSSFINELPKDRLIVELSVNENYEVLIHGRDTNTKIHIREQLEKLSPLGVEAISITFHFTEGLLQGIPKKYIQEIMEFIPTSIKKVIIAGGISSLDDLEFLWSFPKIIPIYL